VQTGTARGDRQSAHELLDSSSRSVVTNSEKKEKKGRVQTARQRCSRPMRRPCRRHENRPITLHMPPPSMDLTVGISPTGRSSTLSQYLEAYASYQFTNILGGDICSARFIGKCLQNFPGGGGGGTCSCTCSCFCSRCSHPLRPALLSAHWGEGWRECCL